MAEKKVDVVKLSQMLRAGKSVKECAKFFGVTPGAISQHKKNLHVGIVKNVVMENAHRIVAKNLNTVDQLQKINDYANELLDLCMRWQRGDNEALQILESQIKYIRVNGQNEPVKEFKFKDPREIALKAMSEIRVHIPIDREHRFRLIANSVPIHSEQ